MAKPFIKNFLENKLATVLPAKLIPLGVMPDLIVDDIAVGGIDYVTANY